MGLSTWICPECNERTKTPLVKTPTGRVICASCDGKLTAAAAGIITATPGDEVASAISVTGWFRRLRNRTR